jgi:hypothetical protein
MTTSRNVWTGWITFTAVIMSMLGGFHIIEGVVGLIRPALVVVDQDQLVVVDLTRWAAITLGFGVVMLLAGLGLLAGSEVARWAAVAVVTLNAIGQMFVFGAYPVWAILAIVLDVVVLYALTVRWPESGARHAYPADVGTDAGSPVPAGAETRGAAMSGANVTGANVSGANGSGNQRQPDHQRDRQHDVAGRRDVGPINQRVG